MKPYSFHELKSTAQDIFINLLEDSDEPLSISTTESGMSPAQLQAQAERIERHVDNLRQQAWGLAEAFLDYGCSKYADIIDDPFAAPPQSTEIPEDVADTLHEESVMQKVARAAGEALAEEEPPTEKKATKKVASTKKKASSKK